jgi:predicted secreted acid phosphatase
MINLDLVHLKISEALTILFKTPKAENNAIIFDIDDTLICSQSLNPIVPVVQFYNFIKDLGIHPIIITARPGFHDNIHYTISQLESLGISGFKKIFFMPPEERDIAGYKKGCRKNVVDLGYNVIMSIGDMYWDVGEYGGYSILIK